MGHFFPSQILLFLFNFYSFITFKFLCFFHLNFRKCTDEVQSTFYFTTYYPFHIMVKCTDKRTDVWSRNFLIWEINFGLWAVAWAGPWEKGVWADSEQLFWVVFSIFH